MVYNIQYFINQLPIIAYPIYPNSTPHPHPSSTISPQFPTFPQIPINPLKSAFTGPIARPDGMRGCSLLKGVDYIANTIFILSNSLTMKVGKATDIRQDKKPNSPHQLEPNETRRAIL